MYMCNMNYGPYLMPFGEKKRMRGSTHLQPRVVEIESILIRYLVWVVAGWSSSLSSTG